MNYIIVFIFIVCLVFYLKPSVRIEGLTGNKQIANEIEIELPYTTSSCPTMLMEKDSKYYLFNKNNPYEEGINPIVFNTLEDYSEFIKRENKRGNKCPILFLQQSYNTQGEREYKIRPSPTDLNGGAPPVKATRDTYLNLYRGTELLTDSGVNDMPYNENLYPAFDPMNQDVGKKTPLDLMDLIQQTKEKSPNASDPNWGGSVYTKSLIDKGVYEDNQVQIFIPY
jgi:hypothetical protein